jgi:pimeloyl-ACP methyl ester carboxylesterase
LLTPGRPIVLVRIVKKLLIALMLVAALGAAFFGSLAWRSLQGLDPAALEAKYMTPADRSIDVEGARVRVREEGPPDAPAVLMIHGFVFSLESFDGWAAALRSDYRVIRFDLLGHGLTGPDADKRYSPPERAAFIGDLMDALEIDRAVVAGNSLGGLSAWRFAASHPERVEALILVSPGGYPINGVGDAPLPPPKAMETFLRLVPEAGARASLQYIYSDDAKATDARAALMRDMMRRRGNGQAFIDSINEFTLPDPEPDLARIAAPTLILWGEDDVIIPIAQGERMAAMIPGARLARYAGVGHAAQEEAPEATAADVRAFLEALAGE